jgi:mono/diheme cytochrome c family protein
MQKKFLTIGMIAFLVSIPLFYSCNNSSKDPAAGTTAEDSAKAIVERGHYLFNYVAVCVDCHSKRDITKFSMPVIPGSEAAGGFPFGKAEGVPGEVSPPNITPATMKDWTDDEIVKAITLGINKKGDTLFPIMPYHNYSRMAKDDIYAIIAYMRTLTPSDSTTAPRKLEIPPAMFGPLPANTLAENKRPDPSDKINYGQYITTFASCSDCHTPMTPQGPDFSKAFSGGFQFDLGFMKVAVSNITPDSSTGIGTWTEEAFVKKFKSSAEQAVNGQNPGRTNTIMPWAQYAKMKEDDLKAIYAYLRTVPAINNKVVKWKE